MSISLVRDNPLAIQVGATATITDETHLAVSDTDYGAASITYTITTAPTKGTLFRQGVATSSFTQQDLDFGFINYKETTPSNSATSDSFFFQASDPAGNHTATTLFQINIAPPPAPVLNDPGSLTTYAGLVTTLRGMGVDDSTGHNFRLDITANAGQVINAGSSLGHTWSLTGSAGSINAALLTLDYFAPAAAGLDTVTTTLTDLTTNAVITKTTNVTVRPAGNFASIDSVTVGAGTISLGAGTISGHVALDNGTLAYGINNAGEVVGTYANQSDLSHPTNGFFLSNGSFTTLNNPFIQSGSTQPNSIDELHQIVGSYDGNTATSGGSHTTLEFEQNGFLYSSGNWTSFDATSPSAEVYTHLGAINSSGQIVGYHTNHSHSLPDQAFIYQNGNFQDFGPAGTEALGNNDAGQIVGAFAPSLGTSAAVPPTHGFLFSNGVFSLLDAPTASSTSARDVNNTGLIVGYFQSDSGIHGFAYDQATSQWTTVDVPGAVSTFVLGVNDSDQIVGGYDDANGLMHGFVGSLPPPLPAVAGNVDEWLLFNGKWEASAAPGSHPAGFKVAAVADFTADGTSDILWQNVTTGSVDLWKMQNGAWAGSVDIGTHPAGYQIAGSGDFNHDGTSDVLWFNPTSGDTDIWELSNGQWAASVTAGAHPLGYQLAGIGDFNRDGTSDILWFNPTTGDVDEWNIANGHWAGSNNIGNHPSSGWQVAGIGDFNNDGTSDVFWYNAASGQTDIWELANGHWMASVSPGNHPTGWQVAGIGDFNGDGTSDVLWQSTANGAVEEWTIVNGHWTGTITLGTHPGSAQIAGIGDFNGSLTSDVLWHQFV